MRFKFFRQKEYWLCVCAGFFFFLCTITGRDLARSGNILWSAGYTARTLSASLILGMIMGIGLFRLCTWKGVSWRRQKLAGEKGALLRNPNFVGEGRAFLQKLNAVAGKEALGRGKTSESKTEVSRWETPGLWLAGTALIVLCWLPCYLAYYPGICAYDTTLQTGQIEGNSYNDHHPIAHTLLIAGAMRLGEQLGDINTGIGILVFVQMTLLAAVLGGGIVFLRNRGIHWGWLLALLLFFMFYPFHMFISVSVIKDVAFSIFFVLQMLALCELVHSGRKFGSYDILLAISSVGMQLFRTNGRYAMLVLLFFLMVAIVRGKARRLLWIRIFTNCLVTLVLGTLCLNGLFRLTNAQQGDRREMLSMPIQQMARCMVYHGGVGVLPEDDNTMSEEDKALIRDFLLDESYREYRPDIADPVKRHTNTYVVRYRAEDFAKTYLRLFARYPGDYINAVLAVNAGYLYLGDESHAHINENGVDRGLGYVQTRWVENELNPRGIYKDSKWEELHEVLEKWADENAYLELSFLKYLFVPGITLWLYVLLFVCLMVRRKYAECMPLALAAGYYLTLFLGPTVQLRYLYPLMIALPFAALSASAGHRKTL